ncbi:TPA: ABC transporter permease [Burkholderia stabilis]|nr:ABC transporter permease [Burkholderia stabilis]HDR9647120.1 ABC transporter permease [Burkholderia stabilis]HDR9677654.1 ABC transporter permease [Burkholderia stabilis]
MPGIAIRQFVRGRGAAEALGAVRRRGTGGIVPIALLALWQLAAMRGWVAALVLPSPAQVGQALAAAAESGVLAAGMAVSLRRVAVGYLLGVTIGLPLGILMTLSPVARKLVAPGFYFIMRVPLLAWVPFLMVLFGIGETLKLVIIAKSVLAPVTLNTERAMKSPPPAWTELGRALSLNRRQTLRCILFPATVLPVFVGLRLGLVQGWAALVGVELLASTNGIGYQLTMSRQLFELDTMMALMLVIGAVGLLLDRGLARAERSLARRYGGAP